MSTLSRQHAAIAALNNVTVKRDEHDSGYIVRKGGAKIVELPDAFLGRNGKDITQGDLLLQFSAAFDGVDYAQIRQDRAEVERRSGDVFCKLGLWGPN